MDREFYPVRKLIMLPGPTNVRERVLHSMIKPVVNHRGDEFHGLYEGLMEKCRRVFMTRGEIVILTASGTGGVEAAALNVVRSGDKVVVPVFGEFCSRVVEHVRRAGGEAIEVRAPMGKAPKPDDVISVVEETRDLKALFVVYNETSPGVTYRWLKEVSRAAKKNGAYVVVDAISILGGDELRQDEWGIDMVVAGSQKCLALPPGLAILSVSEELREYIERDPPRTTVYFDLTKYFTFNKRLETPFTPALPLFYALDEALELILEEGVENRVRRHKVTAEAFYSSLEAAGLEPFVDREVRSNTVIAVSYPDGVDDVAFRKRLEKEHGVVVAGGFGELRGRIFRIGNMGETNGRYVLSTVTAILSVMLRMGVKVGVSEALELAYKKLEPLLES